MAKCIRCGRELPAFSFRKICQWCVRHEAAQRGEAEEDAIQPVMAAPWAQRESAISLTKVLFGINIAVFVAMVAASDSATNFPDRVFEHFGANIGTLTLSGDWWRLLTYMFLHGSLMHIGFNMWCLWDLGALCESLYGRWTYAAIYLTTGIAAGLASVGWNPNVSSVGASGAIFGLAGALISGFALGEFSLPSIAIRSTLRSLVLFAVVNLFLGGLIAHVDNAAHVGGLVSGLLIGALIAWFAAADAPRRRFAVLLVSALAVLGAGIGIRHWRGGSAKFARAMYELNQHGGDPIARLQLIEQVNPNLVSVRFALAQEYFNRQQFAQAEAEFKQIIQLQPANQDARFDLGETYMNEKRLDDAKASFQQMLAQDPKNADAHYGLAMVLDNKQQYEAAIDEYKVAIAGGSNMSGVYYGMGNAYAKLHQYDDAIAAYRKEQEASGDDPDVENALAECYQLKGMAQQAQEARAKAMELQRKMNSP
ncbi:MAG TPA: rhomboid family intramembrane serine protease [Candidatus Binatia bacterium]|jgi:membrane associated rhomboid family serine protease/Flp pilus assembly protein TadD|nr:rhomboid family intramembrane serine protease [Candidatus Binatia bacterium]